MKKEIPAEHDLFASGVLKKVEKPPRPARKIETVTEADFMDPGETIELNDEDIEMVRESGIYEGFTPTEIQKQQVVKAVTFESRNGIEGGITLEKKRERGGNELNEDCVLAFEDKDLGVGYGSFDGLGGEGNGALASAKAVEVLPQHLIESYYRMEDGKIDEAFEKLTLITLDSKKNKPVIATAEQYKDTDLALRKKAVAISEALKRTNEDVKTTEGKTTACFTLMHTTEDGKRYGIVANIGDSGAIIRRADGSVSMLTKEDNALTEAIDRGIIPTEDLKKMKEDPRGYKFRGQVTYSYLKRANTQSLGLGEVTPKITIIELQPGDEIYNLTDGILDFFEDDNHETNLELIQNVLNKANSLKERMEALREVAGARSKVLAQDPDSLKDSDDSAISAVQYKLAA